MGKGPRIDCSGDELLTQQSAKDECDINIIIERAKRGAVIEPRPEVPRYGDFTQIPTDLRECLVVVRRADELFMSLDAQVRKRFDNDPAKMLDFLNDGANREEAVALGLVNAPPPPPVKDESLEALKSIDKSLRESSGAKKSKSHRDDDE